MSIDYRSLGALSIFAWACFQGPCLAATQNNEKAVPPPKQAPRAPVPGQRAAPGQAVAPGERVAPGQRLAPGQVPQQRPVYQRPGTSSPGAVSGQHPGVPQRPGVGQPQRPVQNFYSNRPAPGRAPGVLPGGVAASHASYTRLPGGGTRIESHYAGGGRSVVTERPVAGGIYRVTRTGGGLNGMTERPLRPGFVSRTYVVGGRPMYSQVYSEHVFHGVGYVALVPAVTFAAAYYAWAVHPWSRPVAVSWGWNAQPWYGAYGGYFTPYPAYSSLDMWMTDYAIADNLQESYQANQPPPPPGPMPQSYSNAPGYAPAPAQAPADAAPPQPTDAPPADAGPLVTADVKEMQRAAIKAQLDDGQRGNTAPPGEADLPPALWTGHTFFRVTASQVDVGSGPGDQSCSLKSNDYIQRTGGADDHGMVPIQIKASGRADCPQGLQTQISVNDLMVMENAQAAQVDKAMQAAPQQRGLPNTLYARAEPNPQGQTSTDTSAPQALNQAL